jgi:hypothetical protein
VLKKRSFGSAFFMLKAFLYAAEALTQACRCWFLFVLGGIVSHFNFYSGTALLSRSFRCRRFSGSGYWGLLFWHWR